MIEYVNASKNPSNSEFVDFKRYIGVASVNIVAVNPSNEKLRKFGWNISDGADEQKYVVVKEKDGKPYKYTKVRFLAQIQDLDDKPIVAMDFFCRPELSKKSDGSKWKIIDAYGRTAWGTREEIEGKQVPQYANGSANISVPYRICHPGEEELIRFLMKYLNVTPLTIYDKNKGDWVATKNPGRLTIDHWDRICDGDTKELVEYLSLQPDNRVKVVFGVQTTDDNKTYQTFIMDGYIGNGASPDVSTGEYSSARRLIDKYGNSNCTYSAAPVKEWKETPTEVTDKSEDVFSTPSVDEDDLPWSM